MSATLKKFLLKINIEEKLPSIEQIVQTKNLIREEQPSEEDIFLAWADAFAKIGADFEVVQEKKQAKLTFQCWKTHGNGTQSPKTGPMF